MDAFALALSYGLNKISKKSIALTALFVGIFHFFMPLLGNLVGISLFEYTVFKPKYILFMVFLILSVDMFMHFFEEKPKLRVLNVIGIILFSFSVSFDSFSVGLGINYLYDNIILCVLTFSVISLLFTLFGFILGKVISRKIGKYSFIMGAITLFMYSLWVLTK